jgi:hypothetical protein
MDNIYDNEMKINKMAKLKASQSKSKKELNHNAKRSYNLMNV